MKRTLLICLALLIGIAVVKADYKSPTGFNYQRGLEALNEDDKDEALKAFAKEVEINPTNGYAFAWIGYIHTKNNQWGDALSAFNSAVKFLPTDDKPFYYSTLLVRSTIRTSLGDTIKALDDVNDAININPENIEGYEQRAQLLALLHRYAESDADYDKMIQLDDGNVGGYMGKAINAYNQEMYDVALTLFNQVLMLDNDNGLAYEYRTDIYIKSKRYSEAADDIVKGGALNDISLIKAMGTCPDEMYPILLVKLKAQKKKEPNDVRWPFYIAQFLRHQKRYKEAIEQYIAADSVKSHPTALTYAALCYQSLGNYTKALYYVDKALETAPDNWWVLGNKADILCEAGKIDECLSLYQKIIDDYPEIAIAYYRKGDVEDSYNMTDAAIEDYTMSIELNPRHASSYLGRGDMYSRKGEVELATADYQKVVELDTVPNNGSCAMYALLHLGRKSEAIDFMERVIANDTTHSGNYYDGTCFYCLLGDYDRAMTMLCTAFEKGYRRFAHLEHDDDLAPLRKRSDYKKLLKKYKNMVEE